MIDPAKIAMTIPESSKPNTRPAELVRQGSLQQGHAEHVDDGAARPGHHHERDCHDRAVHDAQDGHRNCRHCDAGEQRRGQLSSGSEAVHERRGDHPSRSSAPSR